MTCTEQQREQARQYHQDNRDRINANRRARDAADPERVKRQRRERYERNREHMLERGKIHRVTHNEKPGQKEKDRAKWAEWYQDPENRERSITHNKAWRQQNVNRYLLSAVRARAKRLGLEFNLTLNDIVIPEFCPIFGVRLEPGTNDEKWNSPSLDRMDSSKGYIKGNVQVISWRANFLKSDGTLEEFKTLVANWNAT